MNHAYAMRGPWALHHIGHGMREALREAARHGAATWNPGHHGPHDEGGAHERRHRGGPWGRGPFGGGFGPGGPFGGPGFPFGGRGFGRGRKAKRGDVRAAILALLAEEPRNGYQIIQEIAQRSQGGWKPSPGAVYPALQQLTDEGLVRSDEAEGRKTFRLTEAGQTYIAEHPDEVRAPWEEMTPDIGENVHELFDMSRQAASALFQIAHSGSESQVSKARQVLAETRRKLYHILADGDTEDE
ncbi:PadR family transcriptional regulator [Microtetraspora malaysiensis]|uniref:PadR family transcriptional regulator n=1 Tax=Microtetraspora malaysiensis TaxID=161358 RepID=UPI000AE758E3|nr:PadR family transcriptional regulator [Microtetraspora malaysiensis]